MSSSLVEFLTSKEILVVYLIAGVACLVCFIIYLVERNNEKLKQKHNTRELKKLVEQIKDETYIYDEEEVEYEKPILETIEYGTDEVGSVSELIEHSVSLQKNESSEIEEDYQVEENNEELNNSIMSIEFESVTEEKDPVVEVNSIEELNKIEISNISSDELEYTDIEPDQATAKLELKKIEEELRKQDALSDVENIALTNYEEKQEEEAIISLEELLKKSKEMYEKNEVSQYAEEGNVPISLQDLEKQAGERTDNYNEPFIIENVVPENSEKVEIEELLEEENDNNIKEVVSTESKFKISPIISPIYGIKKNVPTDLALENTANYEKLDEEIKKTNDFLSTLKDLQNKLDKNN